VSARLENYLKRWTAGGIIDGTIAERIRAFEAQQEKAHGMRWPVLLAVAFGGLLLCAGVLLFVAAHWDALSPGWRFGLVLAMVALFHLAGAASSERFPPLASSMHAVGTISLGAGIFLSGQIFHLQEHWPGGVMLWAIGAGAAWALLRDWPQAALTAVLVPAWLGGEWIEAARGLHNGEKVLAEGLLLLALTYLSALTPGRESSIRKALVWIGGIALFPLTVLTAASGSFHYRQGQSGPEWLTAVGWAVALVLPLALSWFLRRKAAWTNAVAALWVILLGTTSLEHGGRGLQLGELGFYLVSALGAVALVAWGVKEGRGERVNLGIAGFALTILGFYFSTVMDKLGRSASMVGLGLLFLLGGWLLEKTRRRLMERLKRGEP
jgi:MFS family permease